MLFEFPGFRFHPGQSFQSVGPLHPQGAGGLSPVLPHDGYGPAAPAGGLVLKHVRQHADAAAVGHVGPSPGRGCQSGIFSQEHPGVGPVGWLGKGAGRQDSLFRGVRLEKISHASANQRQPTRVGWEDRQAPKCLCLWKGQWP